MSFGFDVLAALVVIGFYVASKSRTLHRDQGRPPSRKPSVVSRPVQRSARPAAPVQTPKPAWMLERERRAIAEGKRGEAIVQQLLHQLQLPALHDIMLSGHSGPTQLDHVVKTPWGLAVLETKHYAGFIFGNPQGERWTQRFYNGDDFWDRGFQNPLRQNYGHIKAVERAVEGLGILVEGFVIFSGEARIGDTVKDFVLAPPEIGEKLWGVTRRRAEPFVLETAWERLRQASSIAEVLRPEHGAMMERRSREQPGSFS